MYKFVQVWLKPLYSNRVSIWSVFVCTTYKYCVQILTKNTTYKYWPNTDPIWLEGFQPNQYVLSVFWSVFVHTYCVHRSTCTFLIHTCTKWNMSWRYLYICCRRVRICTYHSCMYQCVFVRTYTTLPFTSCWGLWYCEL